MIIILVQIQKNFLQNFNEPGYSSSYFIKKRLIFIILWLNLWRILLKHYYHFRKILTQYEKWSKKLTFLLLVN